MLASFGQDLGGVFVARVALVLWYLGYPDQAWHGATRH